MLAARIGRRHRDRASGADVSSCVGRDSQTGNTQAISVHLGQSIRSPSGEVGDAARDHGSVASSLFLPSSKRLLEGLLTGGALLHGEDCAPIVGVDDRDIDPGPTFEKLEIALLIGVRGRELD